MSETVIRLEEIDQCPAEFGDGETRVRCGLIAGHHRRAMPGNETHRCGRLVWMTIGVWYIDVEATPESSVR